MESGRSAASSDNFSSYALGLEVFVSLPMILHGLRCAASVAYYPEEENDIGVSYKIYH